MVLPKNYEEFKETYTDFKVSQFEAYIAEQRRVINEALNQTCFMKHIYSPSNEFQAKYRAPRSEYDDGNVIDVTGHVVEDEVLQLPKPE